MNAAVIDRPKIANQPGVMDRREAATIQDFGALPLTPASYNQFPSPAIHMTVRQTKDKGLNLKPIKMRPCERQGCIIGTNALGGSTL